MEFGYRDGTGNGNGNGNGIMDNGSWITGYGLRATGYGRSVRRTPVMESAFYLDGGISLFIEQRWRLSGILQFWRF